MPAYPLQELLGQRPVKAKFPVLIELDDNEIRKRPAPLRKEGFAIIELPQASGQWPGTGFLREYR